MEAGNGGRVLFYHHGRCLSSSVSTTYSFPFLFSSKTLSIFEEKEFPPVLHLNSPMFGMLFSFVSVLRISSTIFCIIISSSILAFQLKLESFYPGTVGLLSKFRITWMVLRRMSYEFRHQSIYYYDALFRSVILSSNPASTVRF